MMLFFFFFFFLKQVRVSLKSPTLVLQENAQGLAGQAGHFEDRRDLWKGRWFVFLAFKSEIVLGFSAIRTLGHLLPSSFNRTLEGKPVSSWNWWRTHRSGLWANNLCWQLDGIYEKWKAICYLRRIFSLCHRVFWLAFSGSLNSTVRTFNSVQPLQESDWTGQVLGSWKTLLRAWQGPSH